MSEDTRDVTCGIKIGYPKKSFATKRHPSAYLCPYCRRWHGSFSDARTTRFYTILRQEQALNERLWLFAWVLEDIQQTYNRMVDEGAQVRLRQFNGRYEIVIK